MTETSVPTGDRVVDTDLYLFGRLLVARQENHDIDAFRVGPGPYGVAPWWVTG